MRIKITHCKAQTAGNSETIGKGCNAAVGDFKLIDAVHELIRGSLSKRTSKFDVTKPLNRG